jgi:hypothetical protein
VTENTKLNGWLKLLGMLTALFVSILTLFFTMVKPAVRDAVAEQLKVESIQRVESFRANEVEHKDLEGRLEKRLDRVESKIDRLLERP